MALRLRYFNRDKSENSDKISVDGEIIAGVFGLEDNDYSTRLRVNVYIAGAEDPIDTKIVKHQEMLDLGSIVTPFIDLKVRFDEKKVVSYRIIPAAETREGGHRNTTDYPGHFLDVRVEGVADKTMTCRDTSMMVVRGAWNEKIMGKSFYQYYKENKIFLTHRKVRYVTKDSPEFLFFLKENKTVVRLQCKIHYTDGAVGVVTKGEEAVPEYDIYQMYQVAAGYNQLQLGNEEKEVDNYEVWLEDDKGNVLSEMITFVVDTNSYENKRYLVFQNTLGGFDTLLFTGVEESTYDVASTTAVWTDSNGITRLKKEGVNIARVSNAKSGFIPLSDLPYLSSEFLSTEKIYLVEGDVVSEMLLEDGQYKIASEGAVDFEVTLKGAMLSASRSALMSVAAPDVPKNEVTMVDHNHDNLYYRKDYVDKALGEKALNSNVTALAADMQALIQRLSTHTHTAEQVRFADGETFQEKLDKGKLKGERGGDGAPGASGSNGLDGKSVEIQVSPTHIQWRKIGEAAWVNLIPLTSLKGADGVAGANGSNGLDGKSVELQVSPTHIQWRRIGETAWVNLIPLASLKGADGVAGAPGKNGLDGKSAYEIEKAAGTFKGTQDEWCAHFEQNRSHLKDTDVHVTAAEKKLWNSSICPLIVNTMQTFYLHSLNKRWVNILGLSVKNSNNSGGLDRANGAEILYQLSAEVTFKLIGNNIEERIAMFTVNIAGSTYAGAGVTTCNIVKHIDNLSVQFSTTATQTIRPDSCYEPAAEHNILSAYVDRSVLSSDNSTRVEVTIRRTYKQSSLFNESDKNFDDSFISYNYENRKYQYADNTTDQDIAFCKVIEVDGGKGKLEKVSLEQKLPAGIGTAYDILQKIGIEANADLTSLLSNTKNVLFNALSSANKDTLVDVVKWLIEMKLDNKITSGKTLVGNASGIAEEADSIPIFNQSLAYEGQMYANPLFFLVNAGGGNTSNLKSIAKSSQFNNLKNQVIQIFPAVANANYIIHRAYLIYQSTSGSGTIETTPSIITLSTNDDGTAPFANLNYSRKYNGKTDATISNDFISLSNGIYVNMSNRVGGTDYCNMVVVMEGVYV